MDKNVIIKRLNDVLFQLEGVPTVGHENRKRMVIAVEILVQLANEINEKMADGEVEADETAEAQ